MSTGTTSCGAPIWRCTRPNEVGGQDTESRTPPQRHLLLRPVEAARLSFTGRGSVATEASTLRPTAGLRSTVRANGMTMVVAGVHLPPRGRAAMHQGR